MSEMVGVELNLDATSYIASAQAAASATDNLQQQLRGVTLTTGAVSRALSMVTPGRAATAAFGAFTTAAAMTQQQLSNLQATATVTGANTNQLAAGMRGLAREFPIGARNAQATVETLNRLGVTGRGTEKQVISLSKSMTQLAGATGEAPQVLAEGMTQLSRTFGTLDTKRIDALNDSITTLKAETGASASAILDFSRSISPMAKAAGLGQTSVMGISASFAKMGEDGFAAANAVTKMLGDMNRSVREGSSEMNVYADIVGKTREEFSALFKANPAEAMVQVTEAIAQAGPRGPRLLESVGLEGVRTQRVLQAAAQSGSLRTDIATSINAYGNDSTQKAAEAAFGGLNDNLNRLSDSSRQVAEAFGAPLLTPLSKLTGIIGGIVGTGARAANSGPGQMLLTGGLALGAAALLAKAVVGPLLALGTGHQLAYNGPLASAAAGMAMRRSGNDPEAARRSGLAGRYGAAMITAQEEGRLHRTGTLARWNERMYAFGGSFTEARMERRAAREERTRARMSPETYERMQEARQQAAERGGLRGSARRFMSNFIPMTAVFARTAADFTTAAVDASRTPVDRRVSMPETANTWRPLGQRLATSWRETMVGSGPGFANQAGSALRNSGQLWTRFANDMGRFATETRTATTNMRSFRSIVASAGQVIGRPLAYGAGLAMTGTAAAGRVGGSLAMRGINALGGTARVVGGTAAAVGAGFAIERLISAHQDAKAETERIRKLDLSGDLNRYREAMSRVGETSVSLAQQFENSRKLVDASVTTMADALEVRAVDIETGRATTSRTVTSYAGDPAAVAARINAMNPAGLQVQDIQDVKVDLLRQFQPDVVRDIMTRVGEEQSRRASTRTDASYQPGQRVDVSALVGAAADDAGNAGGAGKWFGGGGLGRGLLGNLAGAAATIPTFIGNGVINNDYEAGMKNGFGAVRSFESFQPGGKWDFYNPSEKSTQTVDAMATGIASQHEMQRTNIGSAYADENQFRAMDQAIREAMGRNDQNLVAELSKRFSLSLTNTETVVTAEDVANSRGGSFVEALMNKQGNQGNEFMLGKMMDFARAGGRLAGPSRLEHSQQISPLGEMGRGFGTLGSFYDNTVGDRPVAPLPRGGQGMPDEDKASWRASAEADSRDNTHRKVRESLMTPEDAGKFADAVDALVLDTHKAGQSFADLAAQSTEFANKIGNAASPAYIQQQAVAARAEFLMNATSRERDAGTNLGQRFDLAQRRAALDPADETKRAERERGAQDLVGIRGEVEEQMRARLQMERSSYIARTRAKKDYEQQVSWIEADYTESRRRAREQFDISVDRAERNNRRQRVRADKEFHRQQERAQEDFDRSISRQIEDAASTMYEPYQRMQTQAVWDARSLVQNINEQTAAMETQRKNLARARDLGLSQRAIDQLGLGKTENAQQLAKLIDDMTNDPAVVEAINRSGNRRAEATEGLFRDPTNKELARGREDFNRNLRRQTKDFNRHMNEAKSDFDVTMKDMADDQARAMSNATKDHTKAMSRMETQYNTTLTRMREDINEASKEITADFQTLQTSTLKAMNDEEVKWTEIMTNGLDKVLEKLEDPAFKERWQQAYAGLGLATPTLPGLPGTFGPHGGDWDNNDSYHPVLAGNPPVSQGYGVRNSRYATGYHTGVDYAVPIGTAVMAALDGIVSATGNSGPLGNNITIDHGDGHTTRYAHLYDMAVQRGQTVQGGQQIARSGNTGTNTTGAHLHWEAKENGRFVDPKQTREWRGQLPDYGIGDVSHYRPEARGAMEEAKRRLPGQGWGADQWDDLFRLWDGESGWNWQAANPNSTARGIPQAMMSVHFGQDWYSANNKAAHQFLSDARTQIEWGLRYIKNTYGSPEAAYRQWNSRSPHWYGDGAVVNGPQVVGVGERGPEAIIPLDERGVRTLAESFARYVSADEIRSMMTADRRTPITYISETNHYDQRNDFTDAKITVQAQDPDEMAVKLAARQRRSNLVGSRR